MTSLVHLPPDSGVKVEVERFFRVPILLVANLPEAKGRARDIAAKQAEAGIEGGDESVFISGVTLLRLLIIEATERHDADVPLNYRGLRVSAAQELQH
ncbi:hypothetical protein N9B39_01920 [bacterium]|nr:hypothetical protein [bacterium]MDB4533056.1 hypothetical protein [bacterium]